MSTAHSMSASSQDRSIGELNPQAAGATNVSSLANLTDEEILDLEPPAPDSGYGGHARLGGDTRQSVIPSEARNLSGDVSDGALNQQRDSSGETSPRFADGAHRQRNDTAPGTAHVNGAESAAMPEWMQVVAANPRHGGEAQQLWREHQEFRAAFASPEEARAIKELLPGGVRDVLSLREATQSVERIDAALFSGDAGAQSEVVAELARVNPAAFRSLFAEAAKVLAGLGAGGREAGILEAGGRRQEAGSREASNSAESPVTGHESPVTNHDSPVTNQGFDPAAYATFERSTNDAVARDVRGSISETLARVLPEGVADGAARRIGEDIFQEIHRALASDRMLSEQVATVLRERRFRSAEQQQVSSLLAGRARQLVPSVARRVIGEWTSSVLNTSRSKAARQAAAASRVDIAAPGGSLDSMPLRQMSSREVDYASMSDEQILGI